MFTDSLTLSHTTLTGSLKLTFKSPAFSKRDFILEDPVTSYLNGLRVYESFSPSIHPRMSTTLPLITSNDGSYKQDQIIVVGGQVFLSFQIDKTYPLNGYVVQRNGAQWNGHIHVIEEDDLYFNRLIVIVNNITNTNVNLKLKITNENDVTLGHYVDMAFGDSPTQQNSYAFADYVDIINYLDDPDSGMVGVSNGQYNNPINDATQPLTVWVLSDALVTGSFFRDVSANIGNQYYGNQTGVLDEVIIYKEHILYKFVITLPSWYNNGNYGVFAMRYGYMSTDENLFKWIVVTDSGIDEITIASRSNIEPQTNPSIGYITKDLNLGIIGEGENLVDIPIFVSSAGTFATNLVLGINSTFKNYFDFLNNNAMQNEKVLMVEYGREGDPNYYKVENTVQNILNGYSGDYNSFNRLIVRSDGYCGYVKITIRDVLDPNKLDKVFHAYTLPHDMVHIHNNIDQLFTYVSGGEYGDASANIRLNPSIYNANLLFNSIGDFDIKLVELNEPSQYTVSTTGSLMNRTHTLAFNVFDIIKKDHNLES